MRRFPAVLMALSLGCLAAGITVVLIGRGTDVFTADRGRLAWLMADQHYSTLAGLVAPADRRSLTPDRLESVWLNAVSVEGALQRVVRTYTVDDGSIRRELEVLAFDHGTGTFSVVRSHAGIIAMYLLAGQSGDSQPTRSARTYSLDLADGNATAVFADFNGQMQASLPVGQLSTTLTTVASQFRGPASVAAQVTFAHAPYVTVETYLLYRNGLVRVELTFDSNGKITGLYFRLV